MGVFIQVVAVARDLILIGLGIYAAVIVRKQLELKQTEIETRKATEEHLRALQAPSLAKDLKEVSQLADRLSETNRELQARIEKGSESAAAQTKAAVFAGMSDGLLEGLWAVIEISRAIPSKGGFGDLTSVLSAIQEKPLAVIVDEKRKRLLESLRQATKGERPQLLNKEALLRRFRLEGKLSDSA